MVSKHNIALLPLAFQFILICGVGCAQNDDGYRDKTPDLLSKMYMICNHW